MAYEQEHARVTRLIERLDNMRIIGDAWSGNARSGFAFNPDSLPSDLGCGAAPQAECPGACCLPFGACVENVSQDACQQQHGIFGGCGTQCFQCGTSIILPPSGACCFPDGSCENRFSNDCGGGVFNPGVSCAQITCPVAPPNEGACCYGDFSCLVQAQADCGGTYRGDGSDCGPPNPCPPPAGACCTFPNNCVVNYQFQCAGTWLGPGSTCVGVHCGTYYCPPQVLFCRRCEDIDPPPTPNADGPHCCPSGSWDLCGCCYSVSGGYYYDCCCLDNIVCEGIYISDSRLKRNVRDTGETTLEGIPIKTFEYVFGEGDRIRGIMAEDVEVLHPEAVAADPIYGIKQIDLRLFDVPWHLSHTVKLGDAISKVATPFAAALGLPCVDPATQTLRPESTCNKVRVDLNEGRYQDAVYDRFFARSREKRNANAANATRSARS